MKDSQQSVQMTSQSMNISSSSRSKLPHVTLINENSQMNTPTKSELGNLLDNSSRAISPMKLVPPAAAADSLKDLLTDESAGATRINAMLKNFERH